MPTSKRTRPGGETAVNAEHEVDEATPADAEPGSPQASESGNGHQQDPWFEPGAKLTADPVLTAGSEGADAPADGPARHADNPADGPTGHAGNPGAQAEWFLPTGRAALLPDSMTESWDDAPDHATARAEAAGSPPWAGEEDPVPAADMPPPWESGPWPGPGEKRPAAMSAAAAGKDGSGAVGPASAGHVGAATRGDRRDGDRRATATVVAGILPLVIPGLVLGVLSLRRARTDGSSRLASWLAIGLSLAWAVVIVVVATASSGSGCAGYPAALRPAYAKAMADLASGQQGPAQAADLGQAASEANAAAASAQQTQLRETLFAMAGDLEQAHADVSAQRAVPPALRQHLAADGAALTKSCGG